MTGQCPQPEGASKRSSLWRCLIEGLSEAKAHPPPRVGGSAHSFLHCGLSPSWTSLGWGWADFQSIRLSQRGRGSAMQRDRSVASFSRRSLQSLGEGLSFRRAPASSLGVAAQRGCARPGIFVSDNEAHRKLKGGWSGCLQPTNPAKRW